MSPSPGQHTCNLSPSKRPILECSHSCLGDRAQNDNVSLQRCHGNQRAAFGELHDKKRARRSGSETKCWRCVSGCLLCHALCRFQNIKRRHTSCSCCYLYTSSCTCSHSRLIESAWTGLNTGSYISREVALSWTCVCVCEQGAYMLPSQLLSTHEGHTHTCSDTVCGFAARTGEPPAVEERLGNSSVISAG